MGHVALTAGFYLMSKLHMREEKPLATQDLFDLDYVDVGDGLATAGHIPVSHLYGVANSRQGSELRLVIGEAQPPLHKLEYCRRILDEAEKYGIGQVLTFSAMAVDAHPRDPSRVFGVATHPEGLEKLRRHKIEILKSGQIQGMNGVFLAAAAQRGISGLCLLGSMPAFAAAIPYPKASLAILETFSAMCQVPVDLEELRSYTRAIEHQLTSGLEKLQESLQGQEGAEGSAPAPTEETEEVEGEGEVEPGPTVGERRKIEELFGQAARDRSKAFELKRELDRLGVFKDYESRFLDLFRSPPAA
jgi:predicted ATP-grasp superfamily ATP-dependent carboligase